MAKGSFLNKAILVPAALAISALVPWAVTPLHHLIEQPAEKAGGLLAPVLPLLMDAVVGVITGALALVAVCLVKKVWPAKSVAIN